MIDGETLPRWIRIEYHSKETCTIWVVTIMAYDNTWRVYKYGAVSGHGAHAMARMHAWAQAMMVRANVIETFTSHADDQKCRTAQDAMLWSSSSHHKLSVKDIPIYWRGGCSFADFCSDAMTVLQLRE